MDFGMQGKTVLVTGGSSGIGAGIAQAFRDAGAKVIASGATEAEVERARSDPASNSIEYVVLDVRDDASVAACVNHIEHLDVLVNCADIGRRGGVEHDPAEFALVVDVNLNGTMRMCAAARPLLKKAAEVSSTPLPCSHSLAARSCRVIPQARAA